jgi:cbb3-type cytochrome oxidase cytochrome c subunit/peptidoglycan hydrolase CwlO-like protein
MPAAEETYRSQPILHVVFAVSSIAMTLSVVWMIMADHLRPWKQVQREFHHVEIAKLEAEKTRRQEEQKKQYQTQIAAIDAEIKQANETREARASELRKLDKELGVLGGKFERLDTQKRFTKAELDSQRSFYDGMIDLGEERAARAYLNTTIVATERKLLEISKELEEADKELNAAKARREDLIGHVDELVKKREALTREVDRVARVIEQKDAQYFGIQAWLRGLPGVDLMPPTKIQQISLPELTINYNFKEVPRYDRCTTCHQGIERIGYDKDAHGHEMPKVFAAHPHLTDGASTLDPKGNVVKAGLYLDGNGPHPINSFGCTICHGGQGSGTDFTYASHTPDTREQKKEWEEHRSWQEIHHWDEPMLPGRFMESSCLKCHHQVTDVPQAKKLQEGYQRIVRYGCTGCHTIGGEGSFGPDLTDERQVGPNLAHVGEKVSKEWLLKWIKNPHAFRPDSRMPRFYGVTNNNAPKDWPKNHAEIHAIAHYLIAKTTKPAGFSDPNARGNPAKGKDLFFQKGCLACHSHRPYDEADIQLSDKNDRNPNYKPDKAATFDPSGFPQSVRQYARADYGPNLSNIAAKFQSNEQGYRWLANWIRKPESYHPKSLMPNLQLSAEDAADIASWILSVPGDWPVSVEVPAVDSEEVSKAINDLVKLYGSKGGLPNDEGKLVPVPLSELDQEVAKRSRDQKLMFLGEKTISRMGCFGCHNIPGFETTKPIGTPLNGWGIKSPTKLDYGHVAEYLLDQPVNQEGDRDGTDLYYQEKLGEHTRAGFLFQKLHRPRSYDYKKTSEDLKSWDDRLRMPQFAWANDPAAIEEVMTFILGLTGEKISSRYLPNSKYSPKQNALARGSKLLNRYNCTACHVLEMPKYTLAAGKPLSEGLTDLRTNLRASYTNRGTDYLSAFYPKLKYDEKTALDADKIESALALTPDDLKGITIEGMPIGQFENELTVQLWKPVTIRGYTFNVGDTLTLDQSKAVKTEAEGGNFAWLYSTATAERTGAEFSALWNRLPPPLIREGKKVQTPWLSAFLKDPHPLRPAVNLRMPRFHFKTADDSPADETSGLANFFAAHDGAEFPYQSIPERTPAYLAEQKASHPDYFQAGWTMMTAKASPCLSCHAVGPYKPTGGEQVINGPDLREGGPRFRPGYLEEWLAKPSRLVPYTAMPQNVVPRGTLQMPVPKTFEGKPLDMVKAIRDTLLNYVDAVEQQLAGSKPDGTTPPKAGGASE